VAGQLNIPSAEPGDLQMGTKIQNGDVLKMASMILTKFQPYTVAVSLSKTAQLLTKLTN
jgi:hypothetical protein